MFRRKKELQSLVNSSRKSLAEAEEIISKLSEEMRIVRHNNVVLLNKNRSLIKALNDIKEATESNTYGRLGVILAKIKELVDLCNQTSSKS